MSVMSVMRIPMTFIMTTIMILKLSVVIMMINNVQLDGHHADHHGADHKDNQKSDLHEFASFNVALIVILTQP